MSCFQAKKRFNDCLCKNAQLRDEIESLRNEHKRFETLYKKLEKELRSLRREMGEVIEKSTAAYDARWVQFSGHDHPSHASFHPHPHSSTPPPHPNPLKGFLAVDFLQWGHAYVCRRLRKSE